MWFQHSTFEFHHFLMGILVISFFEFFFSTDLKKTHLILNIKSMRKRKGEDTEVGL